MIHVTKHGILLEKTKYSFEQEGVLNPAAIKVDNIIHLFYRAVAKDNFSTIGYCKLSSPMQILSRDTTPLLYPQAGYEFQGLEDPRIVRIDELFYLSYTAYDGRNALGALATSTDLIHWKKMGIIVPQITYEEFKTLTNREGSIHDKYERYNTYQRNHDQHDGELLLWDKNLIFFPRKVNNRFCFLHRIRPDIQIVVSVEHLSDLTVDFWKTYFFHFNEYVVLSPKYDHEVSYLGSGCPPIEPPEGWLLIYHGVHDTLIGYVYSACAALLDLNNPQYEIGRLPYPLFFPDQPWEQHGEVNNVCFPTGAIVEDDTIYIYYGAADERIAVASVCLSELISEILLHSPNPN